MGHAVMLVAATGAVVGVVVGVGVGGVVVVGGCAVMLVAAAGDG